MHCEHGSRLLRAVAEEAGTALGFPPAAISAVLSDPTVNSCCILLPQTDQSNDNDSTARLVSIHPTLGQVCLRKTKMARQPYLVPTRFHLL